MSSSSHISGRQRLGAIIILLIATALFIALHFLPHPSEKVTDIDSTKVAIVIDKKAYYDSLRSMKNAYYDSLRLARRDSLHQVLLKRRDSTRVVDSLWWDSVRHADSLHYTPMMANRPIKKDTIIELNSADTTALMMIRGIGRNTAGKIIRYRRQLGGFISSDQLQDDAMYTDQYGHSTKSRYCIPDSVLKHFTVNVDSVRPIYVNHASINRLQRHPYISVTLAKEIYTLRRKQIRIKHIDEIRTLPSMNDSLLMRLTPYLSLEK
ncbi:MAG: helix-hairpin-helix domain-containing protein [Bacteroidales bacterium]|nr:helix-hairpin-helix domain-containing protein [Candidatus Colicola equi]